MLSAQFVLYSKSSYDDLRTGVYMTGTVRVTEHNAMRVGAGVT